MTRTPESLRTGAAFAAADFGSPAQWGEHVLPHPAQGPLPGKVFLGQTLGLTGMEISLGSLAPGLAIPFLHAHRQNEELYLVLSGEGELQVDGTVLPLRPGTAVRVAPEGMRSWRAVGSEPLTYLVVQAKAGSLEQATSGDGIIPERHPEW